MLSTSSEAVQVVLEISYPAINYCFIAATTQVNCDWIELKDLNTKDGIPVAGANTTEDCKSKCFANLTCINGLGFDFNSNNPVDQRCYFSTSTKLYPNPGIVHYTPKSTCSSKISNWLIFILTNF